MRVSSERRLSLLNIFLVPKYFFQHGTRDPECILPPAQEPGPADLRVSGVREDVHVTASGAGECWKTTFPEPGPHP